MLMLALLLPKFMHVLPLEQSFSCANVPQPQIDVEGACHLTNIILFTSNLYRAIIDNFIYSFYQLLVPYRLPDEVVSRQ